MSLKDDSEQEAMAVDVAVLVFEKMFEKIVRSHRRFNVNMARIGGLMKLVTSDEGQFKSTAFMHYEGVSADILRLIVVFLHAAVEDLIRSQLPKFSFQSGPDIDKALKHAGLDSSSLKPAAHHDEMATPSKPAQKTARAVEGPWAGAAGNQARVFGERRRGAELDRNL